MKTLYTLAAILLLSACASSDPGSTHTIHNTGGFCDFHCQRLEDELIRRDIEDRIIDREIDREIIDELTPPDDVPAELY
ncbi:hypothetical protein K0J45_09605 [Shewanella alkalitolerans]|uniref:hypothetical protein n=1 Tax=Shewanella alkalitolerans TaxID=2864209 RepID=UPI001C660E0F|nr:hypothetical protein [Shewanella alkalitolerans]QYJ99422.1 hypothetical protein K0J45_09605 [Shewanella alkalitolerans]